MFCLKIGGIGFYVFDKVVINDDLIRVMDISDEWIQEWIGIKECWYGIKYEEIMIIMGVCVVEIVIECVGISKEDIDFIIFVIFSLDYYFFGCGVLLQCELGIINIEIGVLDIWNQCSGFVYGLFVVDQFVKIGMYKNVLLVGVEMYFMGLDFSIEGCGVIVIFGDGVGVVVLQFIEEEGQGVF